MLNHFSFKKPMLVLFLCILLIACSSNNGKLDRAKAKKMIIEKKTLSETNKGTIKLW